MQSYYGSLQERDRRVYAGLEAKKLGFGGKKYICELLNIHPATLRKGILDLSVQPDWVSAHQHRQRVSGGGRKKFSLNKSALTQP